ncbi:MAG: hypothetical protein FD121_1201 [Gallionellaceae bacterium]|nr:MAG: hypothetical protein FD121_1201 [Gallionellaceae bacterium]
MTDIIAIESVAQRILVLRGQKVMIDADLAELYGVDNKRLNEQVKRNIERFPSDFMFQLTQDEKIEVVANCDHLAKLKYSRTLPYAFTEHGALMLGNVLKSERAVEMSVFVVRAFVQLREMLSTNKELAAKLLELERKVSSHDQAIVGLMNGIRELMKQPDDMSRPIGFTAKIKGNKL